MLQAPSLILLPTRRRRRRRQRNRHSLHRLWMHDVVREDVRTHVWMVSRDERPLDKLVCGEGADDGRVCWLHGDVCCCCGGDGDAWGDGADGHVRVVHVGDFADETAEVEGHHGWCCLGWKREFGLGCGKEERNVRCGRGI
jgi:hypothetical protein